MAVLLFVFIAVSSFVVYRLLNYLKTDADWTTFHAKTNKNYYRDRIIWITGASSGIGKALVYQYASLNIGCKLILSSRRGNILNEIKKDLIQNQAFSITENDILALPMDCNERDIKYYRNKYDTILEYFKCKSIDVLINNAGYSMRSYCVDFDDKDHIDMYQTNLITPTLLTKFVVSDAINDENNPFAHVVNISSVVARFNVPCRTIYSATKTGLLGFSYSLRDEIRHYNDINISLVLPGPVRTNVDVTARAKKGGLHNKRDDGIQSGMTPERCATLICNGVSNRITEIWPCTRPALDGLYIAYYLPALYNASFRHKIAAKVEKDAGYKN